jgi:4-hydroxy-3-methylbut-2-en-1-yl diphosphate reductase
MANAAFPPLTVLLAEPRGFCAGVDRAIQIVELALQKYGPPVYVRHEIVHNKFVVDELRSKGAVFVEELDEIPDTGAPVIFSAHGVAKSVPLRPGKGKCFSSTPRVRSSRRFTWRPSGTSNKGARCC